MKNTYIFLDTLAEANAFIDNKRLVPPVQYKNSKKFNTSPGTKGPVDLIAITDSEDSSDDSDSDQNEANESIASNDEVSSQNVSDTFKMERASCVIFSFFVMLI